MSCRHQLSTLLPLVAAILRRLAVLDRVVSAVGSSLCANAELIAVMTTNGYLGTVLAAHEDENTDFLMTMATDIENRMSVLKDQMLAMISTTFQEFKRAPRQARRMRASLNVICERVEALDTKIKGKAVPKLENSISEMTGLSKRLIEISLMRKTVNALVQVNDKFAEAQDFQREKKYFEASKAFEMLFKTLEDAGDDVKQLKVFEALKNGTVTTIVNLQDHMTNTLMECFQCKVTTGIDASKMSYYTLKVDKNRIEDFEESFQGLYYLKKLDPYFRGFATWVQQNIILPIIMHCCSVTSENEDGKYMVLKVEADFTMPKSGVLKVFENLTFALTFLKTYLSVKVGANSTIMNELGKLTSNDFCSALITHCLADTIPSHSNQLEEYKGVISATEGFHRNLINIGYLDGTNLDLITHTMNAEKLCATKTTKVLLIRARDIIKKDLYDAMEMEIAPKIIVKPPKKKVQVEKCLRPAPAKVSSPRSEKEEYDKSMLAIKEELHQEFLAIFGLKDDILAKGNSDQKETLTKQQPRQCITLLKETEDCKKIRSPVKEESGKEQSNAEDDTEPKPAPLKISHAILDNLISVVTSGVNAGSVLSQEVSPGKKDLNASLKDDTNAVECSAGVNHVLNENPAHNDSEQIADSTKELLQKDISRPSAEDPSDLDKLRSPMTEESEQEQTKAKEDLDKIRSLVKEESEQEQSNAEDDTKPKPAPVKISHTILDDLISVVTSGVNAGSVLSQEVSPGKKDLNASLKNDTNAVECSASVDYLLNENPAHNYAEKIADSTNKLLQKNISRSSAEDPSDVNEGERMLLLFEKEFGKDHDTTQDSNSSQHNLSNVKGSTKKEGTVLSRRKKAVGDIKEDPMDGSSDEDIVLDIKECGTKFETSNETNLDLSGAVFAFPKCQISKSANELTKLLQEVLSDCTGSSNECVRNLFKTARLIVELYCSIAPIYHKKYLDTMPQQAALYHNNCMYIAHCLLTLGHAQRNLLGKSARMIGSFADQVVLVRKQGASIFLGHMHFQREQILDIIRNCGLSTLRECSTLTRDTERALRQCLRQVELLNSLWQPVLPRKVYKRSMACLMNSFLDELINRVVTVQDIPAETATSLVTMFGVVITRVQAIFPDAEIIKKFENWEMFQELVLILGANMKFIQDRWGNGQGPAALCFSPDQLRQLIRALFQNTERRSAVLAEIH